jgi:hypothetical protein
MALDKSKLAKWAALPLCAALGYGIPLAVESGSSGQAQAGYSNSSGGGSASRAPRGKPVTGEITVQNCYVTTRGLWLLGSHDDYTDPDNKTLVIDPKRVKGLQVSDPNELIGAKLSYSGFESFYKGKKQHQATKVEVK